MPPTEESAQAFSTDPHLNDSINDVLSEFVESPEPGAAPAPTQGDVEQVETVSSPAAPSAGDQGHSAPASDRSTPAPDAAAPVPDPEYQPFTYPVNGEVRTMDGSYRIPGEGLFVPEANVPRWQQIAAQAETLEKVNRDLTESSQSFERLTSWQRVTGVDGQGKPVFETLTGHQGLEARTVATATFAAKAEMLDTLLANPNRLAGLLTEVLDPSTNKVTGYAIHPDGLEHFKTAMENAVIKAQGRARQHFAQQSAPAPTAPAAEAPISAVAMPTVEATVKQFNVTGLTTEDKQFLAAQLECYVRPTTPEEQKAGYGPRIVDASFGALVQREGVRVKAASASAQAKAAADKFNTGQQRGRAGQRPAAPVAPIQPAPEPKRKRGSRNERTSPSWDAVFERGFNDPDVQAALAGTG